MSLIPGAPAVGVDDQGPGWIARRFRDIDRDIAELRVARSAQATEISSGDGITIKADTPGAGSLHLWVRTDTGSSLHDATLDFQPSEPTIGPARLALQDDGPGNTPADYPLRIASPYAGINSEQAASLMLAPDLITMSVSFANYAYGLIMLAGQPVQIGGWKIGLDFIEANRVGTSNNVPRWSSAVNTEWRAVNSAGAYIPVRASSFPTSSAKGAKQNVTEIPFDVLDVIRKAPAWQWEYKPEKARDDKRHISPMADDLPHDLVRGDGADMSVDTRDLTGVLWHAVSVLAGQLDDARAQLDALKTHRSTTGQAATPATLAIGATRDVTVTLAQAMPTDAYDVAVIAPPGYTFTTKAKTKTAVTVTLKATVAITAASAVTVIATS